MARSALLLLLILEAAGSSYLHPTASPILTPPLLLGKPLPTLPWHYPPAPLPPAPLLPRPSMPPPPLASTSKPLFEITATDAYERLLLRNFSKLHTHERSKVIEYFSTKLSSAWPKVLLVGMQKAGTSSLFDAMRQHPVICGPVSVKPMYNRFMPPIEFKEVHFFDHSDRYALGSEWYRLHFRCRLAMDGTPNYISAVNSTRRMLNFFPFHVRTAQKILVVLREPVARDLSNYNHDCHYHGLRTPYEDLCLSMLMQEQAGERTQLSKGLYAESLLRLAEVYPMRQILLLNFVSLIEQYSTVMKSVAAFVGVPNWFPSKLPKDNSFRKCVAHIPAAVCAPLRSFFNASNARLYEILEAAQRTGTAAREQPVFPRFPDVVC